MIKNIVILILVFVLSILFYQLEHESHINYTSHSSIFSNEYSTLINENSNKHDSTLNLHEIQYLVTDEVSAIKIAEIILFRKFGKEQIKSQRPYNIVLKNNIWLIEGNIPDNYIGGTFQIGISREDCQITYIMHGK